MKYADKLPRRIKSVEMCCAMDEHGVRCDEIASVEMPYHGVGDENETGVLVPWVAVNLCDYHGKGGHRDLEGKLSNREWFRRKKAGKLMFPTIRTNGDHGMYR